MESERLCILCLRYKYFLFIFPLYIVSRNNISVGIESHLCKEGVHGRLACWVDFLVEYKLGSKHGGGFSNTSKTSCL